MWLQFQSTEYSIKNANPTGAVKLNNNIKNKGKIRQIEYLTATLKISGLTRETRI
jgi:hypothetical protein